MKFEASDIRVLKITRWNEHKVSPYQLARTKKKCHLSLFLSVSFWVGLSFVWTVLFSSSSIFYYVVDVQQKSVLNSSDFYMYLLYSEIAKNDFSYFWRELLLVSSFRKRKYDKFKLKSHWTLVYHHAIIIILGTHQRLYIIYIYLFASLTDDHKYTAFSDPKW